MINQTKALKLIKIYEYVCEKYEIELKYICERFSNNNNPEFTDQEVITIYLFSIYEEQKFKLKQMYNFTKDYLLSWFPKITSYVAFTTRLNRLSEAIRRLCSITIQEFLPKEFSTEISVLDSMPIITCSGKRMGNVAPELTDKSFCSTKTLWYYGVKLHGLSFYNQGNLPYPESIIISKASENDLNVFKENWAEITNRKFFGDKIYCDTDFFEKLYSEKKSIMFTPIKGIKGKHEALKQRDCAYENLFSRAVSSVRQPIESFFNWINQKTQIQNASNVRSVNGLIVHIFGKLTACFLKPILNP
jgi:hypothetical protein